MIDIEDGTIPADRKPDIVMIPKNYKPKAERAALFRSYQDEFGPVIGVRRLHFGEYPEYWTAHPNQIAEQLYFPKRSPRNGQSRFRWFAQGDKGIIYGYKVPGADKPYDEEPPAPEPENTADAG